MRSFSILFMAVMFSATVQGQTPQYDKWMGCFVSWLMNSRDYVPEQPAKQVIIHELLFEGVNKLPVQQMEEIATQLKSRRFNRESDWLEDLEDIIRDEWKAFGYFHASVKAGFQEVSGYSPSLAASVIIHVDEGEQYRLKEIQFTHARQYNAEELRVLFPIHENEIVDAKKFEDGLHLLDDLYRKHGFIESLSSSESVLDEKNHLISFKVDIFEGRQFHISEVSVEGPDQENVRNMLHELKIEAGRVFDPFAWRELNVTAAKEKFIDMETGSVRLVIDLTRESDCGLD